MLLYYGFIVVDQMKTLCLGFNVNCFRFLKQNWLNCSYGRMTENAFDPLPLPSGVSVPMCFCGDPCKVSKSDDENTYRQRYWMCSNFTFEPRLRQRRINKTSSVSVLTPRQHSRCNSKPPKDTTTNRYSLVTFQCFHLKIITL